MPHILSTILSEKRIEIVRAQAQCALADMRVNALTAPPARDFMGGLNASIACGEPAVIAEIKRASPSQGVLRKEYKPDEIAMDYEHHGASCLSILTDVNFFQGSPAHLIQARAATRLPVLRKDFMIDPYQIYESRFLGADCVLLIVAALTPAQLISLHALSRSLGMQVLVEVHTAEEITLALDAGADMIGINNRDLATFYTDINTSIRLAPLIPDSCLVVAESGIKHRQDVMRLRDNKINAFLVGEAFMRQTSPGQALQTLFSASPSTLASQSPRTLGLA